MTPLTPEEKIVLLKTTELWNAILQLPIQHEDDVEEARHAIHLLQNLIAARPTFREIKS